MSKNAFVGSQKVKRIARFGTSLAVQWLRLHASNAGSVGSIPGRGTPTRRRVRPKKKKKRIAPVCASATSTLSPGSPHAPSSCPSSPHTPNYNGNLKGNVNYFIFPELVTCESFAFPSVLPPFSGAIPNKEGDDEESTKTFFFTF